MPIELQVQSGARAGECQSFDKSVIAIGRHPMSDLRFDVNKDLDVSTKHGEIRTRGWLRAHLVKLADDANVDLALVQVDDDGTQHPTVHEVASAVDSPVGASIATIGYPLGTDLPMEGSGSDGVAKTSLTVGTISKSIARLLQIDAFAAHGSSGSPVFDRHGHVIGVVWGGPKEAAGRIVFAVPGDQIKELLKGVK